MKISNLRFILFLAAMPAFFYACQKNEAAVTRIVSTMESDSIAAGVDGGAFSITYSISNPAEDGAVNAYSDADWIEIMDSALPGTVSFTVSPNDEAVSRETDVEVVYTYDVYISSFTVHVVQAAWQDPYPDAFSFAVSDVTTTGAHVRAGCNYDNINWFAGYMSERDLERNVGGKEAMPSWLKSTLQYNASAQGKSLSDYLSGYLYRPDYVYEGDISGLEPETSYIMYAVGLDYDGNYTTGFNWSEVFTTLEEETPPLPDEGPYATAYLDTYWRLSDLVEHNSLYEVYEQDGPYISVIGFEYNEYAVGAYYATLQGDWTTTWTREELRQYAINLSMSIRPSSPMPLRSIDDSGMITVVTVAYDQDGNLGTEYVECLEIGTDFSDDMELFDRLRDEFLGN